MADPTQPFEVTSEHDIDKDALGDLVIKASEALQIGGLVSVEASTHKAEFSGVFDKAIPAGWVAGSSDGNDSNLTGDSNGDNKVTVRGGIILKNVTVDGVSSSTEIGTPVYASDGQTLTTTKQNTPPSGFVTQYSGSGEVCDVYLYSLVESIKQALAGGGSVRETKLIGFVNNEGLQATGDVSTGLELHGRGKIVGCYAILTSDDAATAAGAAVLQLEINGTAVTGSDMALADDDTVGAKQSGTITALNTYNDGDTLDIVKSAVSEAFTGTGNSLYAIYATFERQAGA